MLPSPPERLPCDRADRLALAISDLLLKPTDRRAVLGECPPHKGILELRPTQFLEFLKRCKPLVSEGFFKGNEMVVSCFLDEGTDRFVITFEALAVVKDDRV